MLHGTGTTSWFPGAKNWRIDAAFWFSTSKPPAVKRTAPAPSSLRPSKVPCGVWLKPPQTQPPAGAEHAPSAVTTAAVRRKRRDGAGGRAMFGPSSPHVSPKSRPQGAFPMGYGAAP